MAGSPKRKISPAGTKLSVGDITHSATGLLFPQHADHRVSRFIADKFSIRHTFLINSGRAALTVILKAMAAQTSRTEVILPGYTCFTVAASVKRAGCTAQLVDVQPGSLEYDFDALKSQISPRTLAIVAVYPFNLTVDIDRLRRIAQDSGVYLIEDAAQAIGLSVGGRPAGTIGDVGFYSLSKGKPITSMTGGIIVTNDDTLADAIGRQIAQLPPAGPVKNLKILVTSLAMKVLINPRRYWVVDHLPGLSLGETIYDPTFVMSRMPKTSILLLERLLVRLNEINRRRADTAARWQQQLTHIPGLTTVTGRHPNEGLFLRLPLLCESRTLRETYVTKLQNLGASRMYCDPLEVIPDPALFGQTPQACPHARDFADRLLTLPTHEYVSDSDIAAVVRILSTSASQVTISHE